MSDNTAAIAIGVMAGFAAFSLLNWLRATYVRDVGGEAYFRGWEDCRKHITKFMESAQVRVATAKAGEVEDVH